MASIKVYGVTWCPDCRRARQVFQDERVEYEFIDVEQSAEAAALVKQMNRGNRSVPTIIFPDGSVMVEPSTPNLAQKLRSLG